MLSWAFLSPGAAVTTAVQLLPFISVCLRLMTHQSDVQAPVESQPAGDKERWISVPSFIFKGAYLV